MHVDAAIRCGSLSDRYRDKLFFSQVREQPRSSRRLTTSELTIPIRIYLVLNGSGVLNGVFLPMVAYYRSFSSCTSGSSVGRRIHDSPQGAVSLESLDTEPRIAFKRANLHSEHLSAIHRGDERSCLNPSPAPSHPSGDANLAWPVAGGTGA